MVFSWFDAREAKEFGASLARFYVAKNPSTVSNKTEKLVAKKQEELLENMLQQVVRFKLQNKLNIYKKAQVGNSFKWTLKEAGYDHAFVDKLTSWLMHGL